MPGAKHDCLRKKSWNKIHSGLCCVCACMHAWKVYSTQALTENCMVCRSQRMEVGAGVGVGPEVADAPDVLVADPTLYIGLGSIKQ